MRHSTIATRMVTTCFLLACSLLWCDGLAARGAENQPRPNIVVVLIDDLRWDEVGCAGHPFVKTPHIDRIAGEGTMFRNAFATTPLCSPSRASFLTGLYAHTHGITDNTNRSAHSHQLNTFPRQLHDAGYETAYVGKWHMGNDDTRRPGFDYWVSIKGQGESLNPEINDNGKRAKIPGYITDILNSHATSFVERKRSKPFCLYLSHKAIHPNLVQRDDGSLSDPAAANFIPAERHKNLYDNAKMTRRPSAGIPPHDKPALQRKIGDLPPLGPDTGSSDKTILGRLRMLAAVDEGIGQIIDALQETGQLDNTVFVVASDNGYFNGEHGLSVERRLAYEETARILLAMRYPRLVKKGTKFDQLILNIDLAPTLLDMAGVTPKTKMQGQSIVPLLQDKPVNWRTSFLIEYYTDTVFPRVLTMGYKAVRTDRFKYIHYTELEGMDELYDLQADPYEMTNLIDEPRSKSTLEQMKAELARLLKETQCQATVVR